MSTTNNGEYIKEYASKKFVLDLLEQFKSIITSDYVILRDKDNGLRYIVQMRDGIVTSCSCCSSISITTNPTKTSYASLSDSLDLTGMVVTATCEDGSTRVIKDYTYPSGTLEELGAEAFDSFEIEISYIEAGTEYTTTLTINTNDTNALLEDFEYIENEDGTYTITAWKHTLKGKDSTEFVTPDNDSVIL